MLGLQMILASCLLQTAPGRADTVQILDEGTSLSSPLASQFVETRQCPKNPSDMRKLKELSDLYDSKPFPADLDEITVIPLDVTRPGHEAHMPLACGYNSSQSKWYASGTSYFTDPSNLFVRTDDSKPASPEDLLAARFVPVAGGESNRFRLAGQEGDLKSYHDGGTIGDMRFVPLGNGVYIETIRDNDGVYYYGLVFVPTKQNFDKLACEKSDWLKRNQPMLAKNEIQDVQAAIRRLFMQGQALASVRKLTRYIEENKKQLPASSLARMRAQARELLAVVDGKDELTGFKLGQNPCGAGAVGAADLGDGIKRIDAQEAAVDDTKVVATGATLK